MPISKISLFLAIFFFSFARQLTAMEIIEQPIQKKLLRLDKAILATASETRSSKQSLITAQQSYRDYLEDENDQVWCCGIIDNSLKKNNYEKCKVFYNELVRHQIRQEEVYVFFKTNFERGVLHKDIDYLQNIEINLTNYLNKLPDPTYLKWSIK
jgi:hypothetical protein